MTLAGSGRPLAASDSHTALAAVAGFFEQTLAVARAEARKLLRDPTELASRAVQPVLWLIVFGQVFTRTHAIPTGPLSYLEFMAPGVLAQGVLFTAIFFGIAVIWERDLGVIHKLIVSPAPRVALVLGKAIAGGLRALAQAFLVYVVAAAIGIHLRLDPVSVFGVALTIVLGAALFATFSLDIACLVRSRERFMGIGQLLTMPLFFASSAVYPVALMPDWLKVVAAVNPLTYMVDALRVLMVQGATSAHGFGVDIGVLVVGVAILVGIGSKLYPRLAQ